MLHDLAFGDGVDIVDLGEEVKRVGDKDLCSTFGVIQENLLEHRLPDVGIQSGKGVLKMPRQHATGNRSRRRPHVENLDVRAAIDSATNVDTLLLTAGQGDTALADLCEVAVGKEAQIGIQARVGNRLPIPVRIKITTEADVLADGGVLRSVTQ